MSSLEPFVDPSHVFDTCRCSSHPMPFVFDFNIFLPELKTQKKSRDPRGATAKAPGVNPAAS
jgi:hypothetical protein